MTETEKLAAQLTIAEQMYRFVKMQICQCQFEYDYHGKLVKQCRMHALTDAWDALEKT